VTRSKKGMLGRTRVDPRWWELDERPDTTLEEELRRRGLEFPAAPELGDDELPEVLWCLIRCLGVMHVFLHSTDHLNDRQLYERLTGCVLKDRTWMPVLTEPEAMHVDITDGDQEAYLRFYADDGDRQRWGEEFPEDRIPAWEKTPFDRDRFLPRSEEMHLRFV
jgi:hypothetical protein